MNRVIDNTDSNFVKSNAKDWKSNIPNLLSISRLIIAPIIFYAIKINNLPLLLLVAFWAISSDYFDGYFARKYSYISKAGKILDPIADKLCVGLTALAITIYGDMPSLLLAAIIVRDLLIGLFGLMAIRRYKYIPVSNMIGKVTVGVLAVALVVYIFKLEFLYNLTLFISLGAIFISSIAYLIRMYRFIFINKLNN